MKRQLFAEMPLLVQTSFELTSLLLLCWSC